MLLLRMIMVSLVFCLNEWSGHRSPTTIHPHLPILHLPEHPAPVKGEQHIHQQHQPRHDNVRLEDHLAQYILNRVELS